MKKFSAFFILISFLAPQLAWTSTMSTLCDCLLGPFAVASCSDVESQLALTRFRLDHALEKGWVASPDFSAVKNGRPADPMQAELFKYIVGYHVAILTADEKGAMTMVDGTLERLDFSDPQSSIYYLRNLENNEPSQIIISARNQTTLEGLRIETPKEGELELLEFFRQFGIREDALAKDHAIDQVYADIKRLQSLVGQPDTASWIKTQAELIELDSNLISGDIRSIYDVWLQPFNDVQKAYATVMQSEAEIQRLAEARAAGQGNKREYELAIATLQIIANKNSEIVGRYYQLVREATRKLSALASNKNCDKVCLNNARIVSEKLGVGYRDRKTPVTIPGPDKLKQFVNEHPFAKVAYLRNERNEQIKAAFKALMLQKPFLDAVAALAKNTPGLNQTKAVQLLKIFYDASARMNDFPKITAVLRNEGDDDAKIEQLRGYAAESSEVLVSFARRVDTTALWKELKDRAQATNADFYSRMNDAEKQAQAMGDLSLFSQTNWASVFALTAVLGGGVYFSYEAHHHQDSILDEIGRIIPFISSDKKSAAPSK